ncbi:MAG: tetratricopeptide repeat protein [Thermodesulfobacteriota bacterium]
MVDYILKTIENKTCNRAKSIPALFALSVALITLIVYLPALNNGFVNWDDPLYVTENLHIRSLDIKWLFTGVVAANWHPLTMLSHTVDFALWNMNPWGHHLTSVILHALNTALVYMVTFRLISIAQKNTDNKITGRVIAGAAAALLFGLHPLHVESVAWVSERKDVLSAFFYLIAILLYLQYAARGASKKPLYYVMSLVVFTLALMSKPMAVSLPIVLLILDFYPLDRLRNLKKAVIEKVPFFVVTIFVVVMTLSTQRTAMADYPLTERPVVAIKGLVFYIYKFLLPLHLAPYYPMPLEVSFLSAGFIISLLVILAISAFCVLTLRRTGKFTAAWLYYFVTILPVIGIVQVGGQAAADRYMYLPSIAFFIIIGAGAGAGAGACRTAAKTFGNRICLFVPVLAVLAVSVLLAFQTVKQIGVWKDSITLWTYETAFLEKRLDRIKVPVEIVYYNLGVAYDESGRHYKAIEIFSYVISKSPRYAKAFINRGIAYGETGDLPSAFRDLNIAVKLAPANPNTYLNRGTAFLMSGDYGSAEEDFKRTVALDPENAVGFYNLGLVYLRTGDRKKAERNIGIAASMGLKEARDFLGREGF